MQYTSFVKIYPVLTAHLINLATDRIARTPTYQEKEVRACIAEVNRKIDRTLYDFIPDKRDDRLYSRDEWVAECRKHSEDFRLLESDREELLSRLVAAKKASPVIPGLTDANAAKEQVKDYIQQLLLQGSTEALFRWHGVLSGEEKYLLSDSSDFWKTQARGIDNWQYCDEHGYTALWEPVIETISLNEKPIAYITENSYGVKCLNSLTTMFVDIDTDSCAEDCSYSCLPFGKYKWDVSMSLQIIREFCDRTPEVCFAIYRTRNGLRLLEMANEWNPKSSETASLFAALGSDPLFAALCRHQGTFRARLEVKPWREELGTLQSVCKPIGVVGSAKAATMTALKIKQVHDRWCVTPGELA